jgi:GT2 family glycosyltransferase/glycosyltransferase involved in cell wall biosynthesis
MDTDPASGVAQAAPESRLQRLLETARAAVADGDLPQALRFADAARRLAPGIPEIEELHARLLVRTGSAEGALAPLETVAEKHGNPAVEAELIGCLLALGRRDAAAARFRTASQSYAIERDSPMVSVARRLMSESGCPGWFGISSDFEVWGETVTQDALIRSAWGRNWRIAGEPDGDLFRFGLPTEAIGETLTLNDVELLGPSATFPDFGLDGRSRAEGGRLQGWVKLAWSARAEISLEATDGRGRSLPVRLDPADASGRRRYSASVGRAQQIDVAVRLPDGSRQVLPDSPVLIHPPDPPRPPWLAGARRNLRRRAEPPATPVDIIVPAFRGCDETLACLRSVTGTVGAEACLVVIDDASPEPELSAALDALEAEGAILLLRNDINLGFPATVNRGLALHPDRDVVILNSDAEVFPGWLARLRNAAYSAPDVGTATPFTNTGSIASYPAGEGGDCATDLARRLAETTARVNDGRVTDMPVGVGFCQYIRRDCLDATGLLDATTFAAGYGEEVDLCRRAVRLGWRHVIAADVFVRHIGAASFGGRKAALLERNGRLLNARYPGFDKLVADFQAKDPIEAFRRDLDEALIEGRRRPLVLMISHELPGGIDRVLELRTAAIRRQGVEVLVLRPSGQPDGVRLEVPGDASIGSLAYDLNAEADALERFLARLEIGHIEVHQFIGFDPASLERLLAIGPPYDVYLHDYVWVCPRVTLMDGSGRYCGEPSLSACEACLAENGGVLESGLGVSDLRSRSERWLRSARRVVAPSRDVAERLKRYFPAVAVDVTPWEPASAPVRRARPPARAGVKVAVIGAIGDHKGYEVLLDCARDAADRGLPIEFVVIGYSRDDAPLLATGKVFITGRYQEDEIAELLAREDADLALLPSVWPETWCFALSHALSAGLPVVAFDLGAIAERLRESGQRRLLLPAVPPPQELNDLLLDFSAEAASSGSVPAAEEVRAEAASAPSAPAIATILANPGETTMAQPQGGLAASAEILSLHKGVYKVGVRAAAPSRPGEEGSIVLPAVSVSPGPGVPPGNVEIMTGLRTAGAWLYEARDMIILKIIENNTPIVITSLSAGATAPLEIEIEKLDAPRAAAPPGSPEPGLLAPSEGPADLAAPAPERRDAQGRRSLRLRIDAHLSNRGDVSFVDELWAGAMGENLPLESFAITPLESLGPDDIEYKGLTANGIETPWTSAGAPCGTRGLGLPLVGFAVRLSPAAAARYDCEYRAAFGSGRIVGPLANGAPCHSETADDLLHAVQVSLVEKRPALGASGSDQASGGEGRTAPQPGAARPVGPRFSPFRQEI